MKKRMFVCFFIFTMSVFHLSIPSVVFGQSPAQRVFEKRKDSLFQRNDIRALFPDVLMIFTDPEHQIGLGPGVIEHFLNEPLFLKRYDSNINPQFLSLLTIDENLRMLFTDGDFHTVLQNPAEIKKLVNLIPPPGKSEDGDCKPPPGPELPRATTLNIVLGTEQSGEVGKPLVQPFVVGVLDQDGKPLQRTAVTFTVTAGSGQISGHTIHTDVYGQAQTTLTLGSDAGHHSVMARAAGIRQTQTFTATATAPPPPKEPEPVVPVRSSTEEPPMYWIADDTIYYRPTGGGKEIFKRPQSGTLTGGLAVDTVGGKIYWTERTIDNMGRIQSADLDGNSVETVQKIIAVPYDIAFDAKDKKLYWTNDVGRIQRIKVGSSRVENFRENLKDPKHIAFDVEKRRLYWTAADGIWSIYTDNDTGIPRRLDKEDLDKVRGIAVDNDVVYWTEQTNGLGRVRFMNRMGSGDNKLLAVLESESIPGGIAVDPVGGRVYWTTSRGEIRSAPRAIQTVVMGGDEPAIGIALGGTAVVPAGGGAPSLSSVVSVENTLLANYPNPFNPETWIPYQLSASADVLVSIYAVDGRLVRRLDLGHQSAGVYRSRSRAAYWDGRNEFGERVASGLYFYTLTAGDFTATRKMLIRK